MLVFADGSTAEADVVIGSDGLRSASRASMFEMLASDTDDPTLLEHVRAKFSGLVSYRTVIPREKLAALNPNHRVESSCRLPYILEDIFLFFPSDSLVLSSGHFSMQT